MAPVRARLDELCPGVELIENLRFYPGEKANDPAFVAGWSPASTPTSTRPSGSAHRRARLGGRAAGRLPSAAGRRLAREVEVVGGLLDRPDRPFVAVVGGAKVADKLGVLKALAARADTLCVGGAMAFTFLVALGHDVGCSLVDLDHVEDCRRLLLSGAQDPASRPTSWPSSRAASHRARRHRQRAERADTKVLGRDIPDGWQGLDIGPETTAIFAEAIDAAGTVLWNGPVGAFEDERFAAGHGGGGPGRGRLSPASPSSVGATA